MRIQFSYKELTILMGILVALIVVMLLAWPGKLSLDSGEITKKIAPGKNQLIPSSKTLSEKVVKAIYSSVR